MKKTILTITALFVTIIAIASEPWKATIRDPKENITLHMDLYGETITVPGMEMFGPMNGYMDGNVYGTWTITSCKIIDDAHASIRLSNDLGSETQSAVLTINPDSTYSLHLNGSVVVKRAVNRKLVRISPDLTLKIR